MYRQGDVLIVPVKEIPEGATPIAREDGRIVLAHGEATGHAHAIKARNVSFMEKDGSRYLKVNKTAAFLRHEEHKEIKLPPGIFRVIRQVEYSPEEIRNVAD